jgi:hypothetical protein
MQEGMKGGGAGTREQGQVRVFTALGGRPVGISIN